jgi:hypothetical protein
VEWSEVMFSPFSPPFQRGREECSGRVGDFFSAFQNGFSFMALGRGWFGYF